MRRKGRSVRRSHPRERWCDERRYELPRSGFPAAPLAGRRIARFGSHVLGHQLMVAA